MRTRTAVALVSGVVLVLATGFAFGAWVFGGWTGLAGFVVPFAVLVAPVAAVALLVRRRSPGRAPVRPAGPGAAAVVHSAGSPCGRTPIRQRGRGPDT